MGKWVTGSGSSKIRSIPFNNRVYGYTGKRVWVQSNPFHTRLIGSGPGLDSTHWQTYSGQWKNGTRSQRPITPSLFLGGGAKETWGWILLNFIIWLGYGLGPLIELTKWAIRWAKDAQSPSERAKQIQLQFIRKEKENLFWFMEHTYKFEGKSFRVKSPLIGTYI